MINFLITIDCSGPDRNAAGQIKKNISKVGYNDENLVKFWAKSICSEQNIYLYVLCTLKLKD